MFPLGGLDGGDGGGLRELYIETCYRKSVGMNWRDWRDPDLPTCRQAWMGSLMVPKPQVETRHPGESGDSAQCEASLCGQLGWGKAARQQKSIVNSIDSINAGVLGGQSQAEAGPAGRAATASVTDSDQPLGGLYRLAHNQGPATAIGTIIGRASQWLAHEYRASAQAVAGPMMSGDLRPESNSLDLPEAVGLHEGELENVAEAGTMMIGTDRGYERHHHYGVDDHKSQRSRNPSEDREDCV
jgi:hypothetical protein